METEAHTVATHQEGTVVSNTVVLILKTLLHLQQMMLILLETCLLPSRVGVEPR